MWLFFVVINFKTDCIIMLRIQWQMRISQRKPSFTMQQDLFTSSTKYMAGQKIQSLGVEEGTWSGPVRREGTVCRKTSGKNQPIFFLPLDTDGDDVMSRIVAGWDQYVRVAKRKIRIWVLNDVMEPLNKQLWTVLPRTSCCLSDFELGFGDVSLVGSERWGLVWQWLHNEMNTFF